MGSEDKRKYCSSLESDEERAFGPFDTEAEAVARAAEERDGYAYSDTECTVGRCDYPVPSQFFFDSHAGDMWETLEESVADNGYGHADQECFRLRDPENGMRSFVNAVKKALDAHFVGDTYFIMDGPLKTVALPPPERESDD
jgi:hypothetical protein